MHAGGLVRTSSDGPIGEFGNDMCGVLFYSRKTRRTGVSDDRTALFTDGDNKQVSLGIQNTLSCEF